MASRDEVFMAKVRSEVARRETLEEIEKAAARKVAKLYTKHFEEVLPTRGRRAADVLAELLPSVDVAVPTADQAVSEAPAAPAPARKGAKRAKKAPAVSVNAIGGDAE